MNNVRSYALRPKARVRGAARSLGRRKAAENSVMAGKEVS